MLAIIGVIASSQPSSGGGTHPYSITLNGTIYYHDYSPIQQGDGIYVNATGPALYQSASGQDDVDGDGNIDTWETGTGGYILWSMRIDYPASLTILASTYYYSGPLMSGTILYQGQGSGAIVAPSTSGIDNVDIDADGYNDDWSIDQNGVLTFERHKTYPNYVTIDGVSYYYSGSIYYNMLLYTSPYSDAALATGAGSYASSNAYDWDADGNLDDWSINNGILVYNMYVAYPYQITLNFLGSVYTDAMTIYSGMQVRTGQGTGALAPSNYTGEDYLGYTDLQVWDTNAGVLTFSMKIVHPHSIVLEAAGVYGTYVDNSPVQQYDYVYSGQGTGAQLVTNIMGSYTSDINNDGIDEYWTVDQLGRITWT